MSLIGEPQLVSAFPLDPYRAIEENQGSNAENQEEEEEEEKHWDVFGLSSDEWKESYRTGEFKSLMKLLKIAVYLITFLIVLSSAVVSKASLLLMTAAIKKKNNFSVCGKFLKGADLDKYYMVVIEDRRAWIWCLLFALFVPEILTFIRSMRICIFKSYNIPRLSTFIVALTAESLHTTGIMLMLFLFSEMHILRSLTLTSAVCLIPSLLNCLSSWNAECNSRSFRKKAFDLIALACQTTVILLHVFFAVRSLQDRQKLEFWVNVISCFVSLLVSCAWWENFVTDNVKVLSRLKRAKENNEECRQFMYIFISLWKIILMLALCVIYLHYERDDIGDFFTRFKDGFANVNISIDLSLSYDSNYFKNSTEWPLPHISVFDHIEMLSTWKGLLPVLTACIHVLSSYICYSCGKFVCKICIQSFSYALPISLTVPTTMCLLYLGCGLRLGTDCQKLLQKLLPYLLWNCTEQNPQAFFIEEGGFLWILWLVSQCWLTQYIWTSKEKRMASTDELFVTPMYCTVLIDQSLALNRRKDQKEDEFLETIPIEACDIGRETSIPRILACATMWHETPDEMELLLKSIMRMDNDQCLKRTIRKQLQGAVSNDYYEVETHIFFDDAFVISDEDDTKMVINNFVKDLIVSVNTAASKIYPPEIKLDPPIKIPTPYGGRLIWKLQGDNILVAHLKNKDLIRHKKRWSQVMYMYYLLGYRLMNPDIPKIQRDNLARNTFILALDGDIDFKPDAVQLLVDLMKRNENLGAACGRIHPVGTGMMVYYQKFEYAIGHWLQKATEHMIGCVLCSPGCFSLFRAEALMQENVIRRYTTMSKEAIEYVQFDQGEDRWLCTLLLQSGSRVEYSAASDAYTHCPESFGEFYTQRRRWAPSTMANIMDLLLNYKKTVECNDNISLPYIGYQIMLMMGTILGPGTIFLMLLGAMVTAFGISNWHSLIANFIPIAIFIVICFVAKNDTQILVAEILSAAYALLMMAVVVAISLQMVEDGITSPTAIFLIAMTTSFIVAAILHPREFSCVLHGLIYFLSVPSMYLLLTLYSIINLHVVSWGTREVATKKTKKELEQEKIQEAKNQKKNGIFDWFSFLNDKRADNEEEGSISFSLANLFRCMFCTYPKPDASKLQLLKIGEQLENLNVKITNLHMQIDASGNRTLGFRRRSSLHGLTRESNLNAVNKDDEENDDDEIDGESEEHMYNQISNNQNNSDEYWLTDPVLRKFPTWRMLEKEEKFWKELIATYLYPLIDNPQEKAKVASQLIELRNKVVFSILMLNSLFILIICLLQMKKDTLHIEWPFNGKATSITYTPNKIIIDLEFLQLEPINLILVFFFSIIVIIQFIAMLFHRFQTISHILASTELSFSEDSTKPEVMISQLTDVLQTLNLRPDDTVDGDPTTRRRSTICKLDNRQERRPLRSLSVAYEETLKGLVQNDSLTVSRVRRLSRNPALLGAVRKFSLSQSSSTTPRGSVRSMSSDLRRLDREFSNNFPRRSHAFAYTNKTFNTFDEIDSLSSTASRHRLNLPEIRTRQITKDGTCLGSIRSLKDIKENVEC